MARITVEDCLENVENRFELVMKATRRARHMRRYGAEPLLPEENDKHTVIALREIAHGLVEQVPLSDLEEELQAQEPVTPEEEFAQIFDSPDLNVKLDADLDEEEEKKAKKGAEKDSEDDPEDWDEEEDEGEEEE